MASKFTELFEDVLSRNLHDKICIESVSDLTKAGENFCSNIFKVDFTRGNSKEHVSAVAKIVKIGMNEHLLEPSKLIFNKEIAFYTEIAPTLRRFQEDCKSGDVFDIFPEIVAFRRNLSGNCTDVDENVVIILENLKTKGYNNIKRNTGFNLECTKLILKNLAAFHAIPLALKFKKFDVFQDKIKAHCYPVKFAEGVSLKHLCSDAWIDVILNQEKCKPFQGLLKNVLDVQLEKMDTFFIRPANEPYATLIHLDMWTNNTMQIMKEGKFVKNKFVDFQNYSYGSPLCDLIFFIWSSVQLEVVKIHHEELIKYYYEHFVQILKDFDCDLKPFEYQTFMEQLDENAPLELLHILYIAVIQGENTVDFSRELNQFMNENISKAAAERIETVVEEFGKRGWIKS